MSIKTYPIFLASSYELQPEREKFEIFIGRQNKRLVKKNVMLELEVWEDLGAELNNSRKQDDYNKILDKAEFVVVLFWTKMGRYTREEFELAYQRFLDSQNGRPLVYVYEKTTPAPGEPEESKKEFIRRLQTEGKEQFHCTFDHYVVFENHFQQTLLDLFDRNELTFGKMAERHSLKAPFPPSLVIGRDKELETISEKFKNKGQVILVSAEGGMGKTTLASKYWQENRYTYTHCAYLFCEGGILRSMMDDGMGLDLQGLDDPEKIRQLQRKLSGLADDFLLFLDNAYEAENISEFFRVFSGFNWNVLITSRCTEVLPNKADEINLAHLDPEDAKSLFRNFYSEDSHEFEDLLDRLLKGIGYHTLLTEVFAKNLKEASELGTDLKTFLNNLEEKGLVLDSEDNFEVNISWDESFQKHAASVNDILEILYDFSKLSEEERYLLVNLALLPSDSYRLKFLLELFVPQDKRAYRDSLNGLFKKGWVGGGDQLYRLSPVIQQLVLHQNQETLWEDAKDYLQKLTDLIKNEDDKDNAHTKFKWLPFGTHMVKIFKGFEEFEFLLFLNELGILLRNSGGYLNLVEAKGHLVNTLAWNLRKFTETSPQVATRRSDLAAVLLGLGGEENLTGAKVLLEKALASDIKNFGEDAPRVAIRRSNLATVYQGLGGEENLLEAKTHLEFALSSDINSFGENAPVVATRYSNLATVLRDLGGERYLSEAKTYLEKALTLDRKNFGEDSIAVGRVRSNLGLVLHDLGGKWNLLKAKIHFEKALASDINNLGEDSPIVAIKRSNLALVFVTCGGKKSLLEAKALFNLALKSDVANFGEDSVEVAVRHHNLAGVFNGLGGEENLKKAKALLEKALISDIKSFGMDTPQAAFRQSSLAIVLRELGGKDNLKQAKDLLEKAHSSNLAFYREKSPLVALSSFNLGAVLVDIGRKSNLLEAKKLLESAKAIYIHQFNEDYFMVQIVQSWIDSVNGKLKGFGY